MKKAPIYGIALLLLFLVVRIHAQNDLPKVFSAQTSDKIGASIRQQAETASCLHRSGNRPMNKDSIYAKIVEKSKVTFFKDLPLDLKVTKTIDKGKFRIDNIRFQSQPGVYVTANLYIPEGNGPFPAVINMHGHWEGGRRCEIAQTTAQLLALNGYVCLNVDAWGAGERTTENKHEYHGSNLGASVMNVGKTLSGMQLTDNIRGVDLLSSLPYVDKNNIGATGASGGGNQTMWLAAMDKRIKAAVPVVSIGSFRSYVMNSNCICELLPDGLTFTEEDGVLALIAPRALKILTAMNDANPSFSYIQMLSTYASVRKIYAEMQQPEQIAYELFNTGHGYWPDMQYAALNWFNRQLKNDNGNIRVDLSAVVILPVDELATYPDGKREEKVMTTEQYCIREGKALRGKMLQQKTIDPTVKKRELQKILKISDRNTYKNVHLLPEEQGWKKVIVESNDGRLIPFLHRPPKGSQKKYTVVCRPEGKSGVPHEVIDALIARGEGIILPDLWGTGESKSAEANAIDGSLPPFHTLSRSAAWLGKTVQGIWVEELKMIVDVMRAQYGAKEITIDGAKEVGIACLLFAATGSEKYTIVLRDVPVSYLFAGRADVDYFNMSVHIPDFLVWGDISSAAAIADSDITFVDPVTMSGTKLRQNEKNAFAEEFAAMRKKCGGKSNAVFK